MLQKIIVVPISFLAKISASRPIHTLIITALLATTIYLSIIDEYVNRSQPQSSSHPSFYHPPGSSDYKGWSPVEDLSSISTSNVDQLAIIPLKFKTRHYSQTPAVKNSFDGLVPTERFLITPLDQYESEISKLDKMVGEDHTIWSVKHSHRTTKYSDYLKETFIKLQNVIRGAETYDIVLIFLAYFAMWFTFIQIFVEFRKIGSKFWLAFGSLLSSSFAFLFALGFTNNFLGLKISLKALSEGIPFLVATIGFKHKIYYTKPILRAIAVNKKKHIADIISDTVQVTAWPLIRYNSIVIGAFLACSIYAPHLEGLRNFCILSSSILVMDLLLTFTFYSAILTLKAEINKVHQSLDLIEFLEEDGISANVAELVADQQSLTMFQKNTNVVSFKIAIIVAFFAIHIFALGSSWLYDSSDDDGSIIMTTNEIVQGLSKQSVKYIKVGKYGTIVTIMPTEIFMPAGFITHLEDLIMNLYSRISTAIVDPLISKLLLLITALSVTINVYFLNAARTHLINMDNFTSSESKQELVVPKKKLHKKQVQQVQQQQQQQLQQLLLPLEVVVLPPTRDINNGSAVKEAQMIDETDFASSSSSSEDDGNVEISKQVPDRSLDELVKIFKDGNLKTLHNSEITSLVINGKLPLYALEKQLGDTTRAVVVRRKAIAKLSDSPVVDSNKLPYKYYDYDRVFGACCENVIGFIPIPLGVAGPLIIDGKPYHIPMATTEGCLVASAMRGCKLINAGGGVTTVLTQDGMTRGPCVSFPSLSRTGACKMWLDSEEGSLIIKKLFNSTSRFARLQSIKTAMAGTLLYIRFMTTTGDAMGMNMISKGVDHSLNYMIKEGGWDDMDIISVSGNYCIDKKPAALNWIEGRGKSVVAEARIPASVVEKVLKSNVKSLVRCNINKNLIGSAMAGAMGGFNAQAANLVTAIYIATGQDPAQNVESSNCITLLEESPETGDLVISVSMPSIEVGTIGGGTILEPQNAMLELLGVKGANVEEPGANAKQLAKIIASAVLSAELSLLSALELGHLVQSHMQHNRKAPTNAQQPLLVLLLLSVPLISSDKPIPGSCIKS